MPLPDHLNTELPDHLRNVRDLPLIALSTGPCTLAAAGAVTTPIGSVRVPYACRLERIVWSTPVASTNGSTLLFCNVGAACETAPATTTLGLQGATAATTTGATVAFATQPQKTGYIDKDGSSVASTILITARRTLAAGDHLTVSGAGGATADVTLINVVFFVTLL